MPIGLGPIGTALAKAPIAFGDMTGRGAASLLTLPIKAPFWMAKQMWETMHVTAESMEPIGRALLWGPEKATRAVGSVVHKTGSATVRGLIGDMRHPWTSYYGISGLGRRGAQTMVGLGIGAGYSAYTMMKEDPRVEVGYAPYPGTLAPPPMGQSEMVMNDNLGADGDLAFALHENYGGGKYI